MPWRAVGQKGQGQAHESDDAEDEGQGQNSLERSKSGVSLDTVDGEESCSHEVAPVSSTFDGQFHGWLTA